MREGQKKGDGPSTTTEVPVADRGEENGRMKFNKAEMNEGVVEQQYTGEEFQPSSRHCLGYWAAPIFIRGRPHISGRHHPSMAVWPRLNTVRFLASARGTNAGTERPANHVQ